MQLSTILFFQTADESYLSRLDYDHLSEQALMETMINDFESKEYFQDDNGNYKDFDEWVGVYVDAETGLISIIWDALFQRVENRIHLEWAPRNLHILRCACCKLVSTLDLSRIPEAFEELNLNSNNLKGTLDFSGVPNGLQHLDIKKNGFTGSFETAEKSSMAKSHPNCARPRLDLELHW